MTPLSLADQYYRSTLRIGTPAPWLSHAMTELPLPVRKAVTSALPAAVENDGDGLITGNLFPEEAVAAPPRTYRHGLLDGLLLAWAAALVLVVLIGR